MPPTRAVKKGKFSHSVRFWILNKPIFRLVSFVRSQNIISAEEMEARRHQEGIDAFLSFASSVSSMSSPIKRPPSADYLENIPAHHFNNNNNHIITNNNNGGTQSYYYYDGDSSPTTISLSHHPQHAYTYLSAPSPPKKSRTRTLRTKFKKKTWLR